MREKGGSRDPAKHGAMIQPRRTFYLSRYRLREREVVDEEAFQRMIAIERKRTERSRKPFLLMLLDAGNHSSERNGKALNSIVPALLSSTRETDVIGWYKDRATVGVIFTEIVIDDKNSILSTILTG